MITIDNEIAKLKPFKIKITMKIKGKQTSYILDVVNKFNVIRGNSGRGKSFLHRQIYNKTLNKDLTIESPLEVRTLTSDYYNPEIVLNILKSTSNIVYILDEDDPVLNSRLYPKTLLMNSFKESNNIFIFLLRDNSTLDLALPEDALFKLEDNKTSHLVQVHKKNYLDLSSNYITIVEDSKSCYQFIKHYLPDLEVISAKGIANIASTINLAIKNKYKYMNIIYDDLGSGFFIEKILDEITHHNGCSINLINFKSFEYYLLESRPLIEFMPDISKLNINNKEKFIEQHLKTILKNYDKNLETEDNCILTNFKCEACQNNLCNINISDRTNAYLHKPFVNKSTVTNFF